jgi:transcriptional regulatory protein RtcR
VTMAREARAAFVRFATSDDAVWLGNFRDLGGAVKRMATLAPGGRITTAQVTAETARLRASWSRAPFALSEAPEGPGRSAELVDSLLGARAAQLDLFDRAQLETVLRTCRGARSLSDAGRRLFAVSRAQKTSSNDADRLRKYLARFDLTFEDVAS